MYSVLDICRYVVHYSNQKNYGTSNLRLQKILYFIQAYFLKIKGKPCFKEPIEAWDFGPVVPKAYNRYKYFGAGDILDYERYFDDFDTPRDKKIVDEVVDLLSKYTTTQLVSITHRQSPWKDNYEPYENNKIPIRDLKRFVDERR